MANPNPIGFFDSGVGGLSVMKEVRRILPGENFIYFADSAYCPYGVKPQQIILARAFAISDFLLSMGAKLIVIASNTTSIVALDAVRQRLSVPVVGIEPAVKPAASVTRNGKIGILATGVTLAGKRFNSLVERFGDNVEVYTQPCPGLVELVESGAVDLPEAEELLNCYLDPLIQKGVDTIILGCTHYPFLKPLIEKLVGANVILIDTGEAVARQVARVLESNNLAAPDPQKGNQSFFTSGDLCQVETVIRLLWGDPGLDVKLEPL